MSKFIFNELGKKEALLADCLVMAVTAYVQPSCLYKYLSFFFSLINTTVYESENFVLL